MLGESVKIYDSNHRFTDSNRNMNEQGYTSKGIVIGNDCWIGSHSIILKGSHIGDHAIIGAGCIITFDVPPWSIVTCDRANYTVTERQH